MATNEITVPIQKGIATVEPQGPVSRTTQEAVREYIEAIDREIMGTFAYAVPVEIPPLTFEMLNALYSSLPPIANCRCVLNVNGEEIILEYSQIAHMNVATTYTQEQMNRMREQIPNFTEHEANNIREDYRYRNARDEFEMLEQDMRALLEETAYLDEE